MREYAKLKEGGQQPWRLDRGDVTNTGFGPWGGLLRSVLLMLCAGTLYGFGSYSETLVDALVDANATSCGSIEACDGAVQVISASGNAGMWTNIAGGLLYDRRGFRATVIAGSFLTLLGYGGMLLALSQHAILQHISAYVLCPFWFAAGHGSGYYFMAAMWSGVKKFKCKHHGFAIGMLSSLFGLSSTLFLQLFEGCVGGRLLPDDRCVGGFLGGDLTSYMLFCTVLVPAAGAGAALSDPKGERPSYPKQARSRFASVSSCILCLICALATSSVLSSRQFFPKIRTWSPIAVLSILVITIAVLAGFEAASWRTDGAAPIDVKGADVKCAPSATLRAAARTDRFWYLCCAHAPTVAGAVLSLNISADIVKAFLNISDESAAKEQAESCVRLAMSMDAIARFSVGIAMYSFDHNKLPRTRILIAAPVFLIMSHLLLWFAPSSTSSLYLAMVCLGFADALSWATTPWLTKHAFGVEHSAAILGSITLVVAFFSVIFGFAVQPALLRSQSDMLASTNILHLTLGTFALMAAVLLDRKT